MKECVYRQTDRQTDKKECHIKIWLLLQIEQANVQFEQFLEHLLLRHRMFWTIQQKFIAIADLLVQNTYYLMRSIFFLLICFHNRYKYIIYNMRIHNLNWSSLYRKVLIHKICISLRLQLCLLSNPFFGMPYYTYALTMWNFIMKMCYNGNFVDTRIKMQNCFRIENRKETVECGTSEREKQVIKE